MTPLWISASLPEGADTECSEYEPGVGPILMLASNLEQWMLSKKACLKIMFNSRQIEERC
jgi:hypothetical protein